MPLFQELINASLDAGSLQTFIFNNIQRFHDFANGPLRSLAEEKVYIREFVETKSHLLSDLDYEETQSKAFISLLFDLCERFGFISTTRIENVLAYKEIYLGKRRESAKLFLLQIRDDFDYVTRFEQICTLLQCSIATEEDSEVKPVVTFLNYLAKVIRDTSEEIVNAVRYKVSTGKIDFPFLNNQSIQEACTVPITDIDLANSWLQQIIEACLGHPIADESEPEVIEEVIIENDTAYAHELRALQVSFDQIRRIAIRHTNNSASLSGRGVKPLRSEMEMFIYLRHFGNMHRSKLLCAYEEFPFNQLGRPIEIVDWGCGQGIATFILLEYLRTNHIQVPIHRIVLIEPSELSLRRSALHISLIGNNTPIRTICNFFNDLDVNDIITNTNSIKIHLFSNVLDMDEKTFSQMSLITKIISSQRGLNYFFCISPYITDEKTDRVNAFRRYFQQRNPSYELLYHASNSGRLMDEYWNCNNHYNGNQGVYCTHPVCGCDKKWTRIINVFKVNLS